MWSHESLTIITYTSALHVICNFVIAILTCSIDIRGMSGWLHISRGGRHGRVLCACWFTFKLEVTVWKSHSPNISKRHILSIKSQRIHPPRPKLPRTDLRVSICHSFSNLNDHVHKQQPNRTDNNNHGNGANYFSFNKSCWQTRLHEHVLRYARSDSYLNRLN